MRRSFPQFSSPSPCPCRRGAFRFTALTVLIAILGLLGCQNTRPQKVPGETDIAVAEVRLVNKDGGDLALDPGPIRDWLGQRAKNLIQTNRWYNPFRVNEDQRRVTAWWQERGYFEVKVEEAPRKFIDTDDGKKVILTWLIDEGPRSTIASVDLRFFPPELEEDCRDEVDFGPGDAVNLNLQRLRRWEMARVLQEAGYAHARVYSRVFVDRKARKVHHYFYADTGPRTIIKSLRVEGASAVDEQDILDRTGFEVGMPYGKTEKDAARLALLDTGAFFNVTVKDGADVIVNIGIPPPDSGGFIDEGRIRDDGTLEPRDLPEALDVVIQVVESPSVTTRLEVGVEFDAERLDSFVGGAMTARNAFGSQHHLTVEGRFGYGWLWQGDTDPVDGFYGGALIRTTHPGTIGRLGDLRLTAEYEERLIAESAMREVSAGPGVRATLARGLFFDLDLLYLFGQERAFGPFSDATRAALPEFLLSDGEDVHTALVRTALVWDRRDSPVEAMRGHLLAFRAEWAPGGPLGTHRWLRLNGDVRGFIPLTKTLSVGMRLEGTWVTLGEEDTGVPLLARLFGGGPFGMRGFPRDQHTVRRCDDCKPLGGLSLVEGGLELRMLPPLKQYGLVLWTDLGGVSESMNPFEHGVSLAAGLGIRVRLWHIPLSVDVGYRILKDNELQPGDELGTYQLFFRFGEAF